MNNLTTTDNKTLPMLLSLDISVAFDTLDHRRLLECSVEQSGLDELVLV